MSSAQPCATQIYNDLWQKWRDAFKELKHHEEVCGIKRLYKLGETKGVGNAQYDLAVIKERETYHVAIKFGKDHAQELEYDDECPCGRGCEFIYPE